MNRCRAALRGALAFLLLVLPACATAPGGRVTPYDEALRQVNQRRGSLGWDGIYAGMTREQVERALGRRLGGLQPHLDGPLCPDHYEAVVDHLGSEIRLEFSGSTQSARLTSLTLRLPEGFSARDVAERLKQALRGLEWVPNRHDRGQPEEEVEKPLYRAPGGGLVFINPLGGVSLGDVCVD